MDKNAIKKYAVWARRELIEKVSQKALEYGIEQGIDLDANAESINGRLLNDIERKQRQALVERIKKDGYDAVIEEVAYTWFNRFIALRFMEVNGFLPSHVRVFTDDNNDFRPQILSEALHLEFACLDKEKVMQMKQDNNDDELYKYLIISQCNELSSILPQMFEKIADYSELLIPDYLLREGSVLEQMIRIIPQEDWKEQVLIIGWLYQYYIAEPKEKLINAKKKYTKNQVPFVTQIFTSEWIVKYMVANSLGRLWIERSNYDEIANNEYFLNANKPKKEVGEIDLENLRILDPCMGSGHILVYAFDELLNMYEKAGYDTRDVELVDHYLADDCNTFGFEMDCGHAFQEKYKDAFNNLRTLNRVLDRIDDIDLLGSAIYSKWRYFNHWAYDAAEILSQPSRGWFVAILSRMKYLTNKELMDRKDEIVDDTK